MSKTALLVIDVQVALIEGAWEAESVLTAIADLQQRARSAAAPVVFLQHSHAQFAPMMKGAPTWAIHHRIAPEPGDTVIEKSASDGFYETPLQGELERLGVTQIVVTGLQTEFCVDATCRAALSRGFEVVLVGNAHTTGDAVVPAATTIRHHNYALGNLAHPVRSIRVSNSADVAFA